MLPSCDPVQLLQLIEALFQSPVLRVEDGLFARQAGVSLPDVSQRASVLFAGEDTAVQMLNLGVGGLESPGVLVAGFAELVLERLHPLPQRAVVSLQCRLLCRKAGMGLAEVT